MGLLLPPLASLTPRLECLYLRGRPITLLLLPPSCWPRLVTLGLCLHGGGLPYAVANFKADFEALMSAPGPGLRTLDLSGRGRCDHDGICASVLHINHALETLRGSKVRQREIILASTKL